MMALPASLQTVDLERRRAHRRVTAATADIEQDDAAPLDVTVLDLSDTGFRALTSADLPVDGWVRLTIEGLTSPEAQVKWRKGDEYGFQFAFPLFAEFVAAALSSGFADLSDPDGAIGAPVFPAGDEPEAMDLGGLRMSWADYRAHQARVGERVIALTPLMTEAASALLMRRGEVLSGAELARAIWPEGTITRSRMATLHVIICNLRGRLPGIVASPSRGSYTIPLA